MWEALTGDGRWALALVCLSYLGIVFITSRGLIAAPQYRQLQGRTGDVRAQATVLAAAADDDPERAAAITAVTERLDDLEHTSLVVWRLPVTHWVITIPLSKLAAAWRVLHNCESRLLRLQSPEENAALLRSLRLRLASSGQPGDAELAAEIAAELETRPATPAAATALAGAATEYLHDREDAEAEREYEQQRTALWLAATGLGAVFLIGATLDHRPTMLLGALGGFMSPTISVLRSQRPASWGILVLAPVGGALAAIGGLLLVRMLADPELTLLGNVFLENSWEAPTRPIALALALLFGFSGTLFSRLALTATGQLAPTASQTGRLL
ncbi:MULTISPECIES: hypothetical protein [Streptomyces]|uniref:Integral membrane protein n=1 Tax=Streptomyces solicathayae TaxID=3081768 RepID=A0ABZ0M399_9ACTN|nr:hypothetical protein [Streptomyces sp. HUAS YS2]WOX26258.1 hypothetical protein R2D22_34695 [Streptomyces sp. HUAS YS2]